MENLSEKFDIYIRDWRTRAGEGLNLAAIRHLEKRIQRLENSQKEGWVSLLSDLFWVASIFYPALRATVSAYKAAKLAKVAGHAKWLEELKSLMPATYPKTPSAISKPLNTKKYFTLVPLKTVDDYVDSFYFNLNRNIKPEFLDKYKTLRANAFATKLAAIDKAKERTGIFTLESSKKIVGTGDEAKKDIASISDIQQQLSDQLDDLEKEYKEKAKELAKKHEKEKITQDEASKIFLQEVFGLNCISETNPTSLDLKYIKNYNKDTMNFVLTYMDQKFNQPIYENKSTFSRTEISLQYKRVTWRWLAQITYLGLPRLAIVEIRSQWEITTFAKTRAKFNFTWFWGNEKLLKDFRAPDGLIRGDLQDFAWNFQKGLPGANEPKVDLTQLKAQNLKDQKHLSKLVNQNNVVKKIFSQIGIPI